MPVHSITVTDLYVEIDRGGDILHLDFADIPNGTPQAKIDHVTNHVQTWFDHAVLLSDLPDSEPGKHADPGLPHLFWRGNGPNRELVTRHVLISDVQYDPNGVVIDGDTIGPLYFRLTRLR
jgi:hypothetical protein